MRAAALLLGAALVLASAPAAAQDPEPPPTGRDSPYSPYYSGAFLSMGAFAGPSLTRGRKLDGAWSTSFGAHAQLSTPMQLIDAQAAYLRNDATGTLRSGQDLSIAQDTFSFGFGLHPFFLSYLRSSFWWNLLGSNYLYVGADIDRLSATVEGKEISELDLGLQVGWGLDIPLDDFNDGGAFWLGVQYRYNQYEFETQPIRALDVRQHLFFVRLSYRRNGLLRAF